MEKSYVYDENNNVLRIYETEAIRDFCRDYRIQLEKFNLPVDLQDSLKSCYAMFKGCSSFNQPVVIPNHIKGCGEMFKNCKALNQVVKMPDQGTQCTAMFFGCESFNQPIELSKNIAQCIGMFKGCKSFNQKVIIPENADECQGMFSGCSSFNQSVIIGENVSNCGGMFFDCISLNQKIELRSTNCFYENMFKNCFSLLPENVTIYSKRTTQKNIEKKLQKMWAMEDIKGTANIVIIKNQMNPKMISIHCNLKRNQHVDITEEEIKNLSISKIHKKLEKLYQSGNLLALEISEKSNQSLKTLSIYFDEELCCIGIVDEWDDVVYYYNSGEGENLVTVQGNMYPKYMVTSDSKLIFLIIDEFIKTGKPTKRVKWIKK